MYPLSKICVQHAFLRCDGLQRRAAATAMQRRAAATAVRRLGDRRQILPVLRLPTRPETCNLLSRGDSSCVQRNNPITLDSA